jgi:hypothetical protein
MSENLNRSSLWFHWRAAMQNTFFAHPVVFISTLGQRVLSCGVRGCVPLGPIANDNKAGIA